MKKNLLTCLLIINSIYIFSQASLVKDTSVGAASGINIESELFKYNDKILFKGFSGELSVSNGTESGTEWINIGSGAANPQEFTLNTVTNEVYFSARGPSPSDNSDIELWKTNGFASGTMLAHDFAPSNGWSGRPTDLCENNGVIYCKISPVGTADEMGYSDGTASGSGWLNLNTSSGSFPANFITYNGLVYFSAFDTFGRNELWVTNGTTAGSYMLKDINFGSPNSDPENFVIFNNKLYFTANNGANGRELWVTNGTSNGTYMVADINTGVNSSDPGNFYAVGNRLFFSATHDNTGTELYYMLTNESVILYRDINPGPASSNPSGFTAYNGFTYFNADNGTNGQELWRTDGSIFGIGLFKDLNPTGSSSPVSFEKYNGNLYFSADDGTNGEELWITDGTVAGTVMIADINPGAGSSTPRFLVDVDGELLFHADDGSVGRELWKYVDPALSTDEIEQNNTIKLQPNPTQDYFTILTQLDIQDVTIYDINGKMVKEFYGLLDQYNIENLTAGLYLVNVFTDNQKETIKLMKL